MALNKLVGKTIKKIRIGEFDSYSDEQAVATIAEITTDEGEIIYLGTGNPSCSDRFYATLEFLDPKDFSHQMGEWEE